MTIVDRLMHWLYSIETSHQELTCINIQNPVVYFSQPGHMDIVLAASQSWQSHWESWIHVQVGMGQNPNLTLLFTPYLAALDVHSPIPMVLYALTHPEAFLISLVPAAYQGNVWKSFFQDLRTWEKEDTERISWFMSVSFFCGAIATRSLGVLGSFCDNHKVVDCRDIIDLRLCSSMHKIKTNSNSFRRSLSGWKNAQCKLYKLNDSTWPNKAKYCSISKPAMLESLS